MNRFLAAVFSITVCATAAAQFRETPPAPWSTAVARQKMRALIAKTDPANPQPSVTSISGMLVWYRDVIDDELIAAWKGDERPQVAALVKPLATARVAKEIVGYSWREQRAGTFTLTYAPVLSDLMVRYPESAVAFVSDLTAPVDATGQLWNLPEEQAEAICRILIDMPDTGNWHNVALQVLPHYRAAAANLLLGDLHGDDPEKANKARIWIAELRWNNPDTGSGRSLRTRAAPQSSAEAPAFTAPFQMPWSGPRSGTVRCTQPVPVNGESVFPGMPPGNVQLELDAKIWDARLVPGQGQTQVLIIHNKSASVQKRCVARWSLMP